MSRLDSAPDGLELTKIKISCPQNHSVCKVMGEFFFVTNPNSNISAASDLLVYVVDYKHLLHHHRSYVHLCRVVGTSGSFQSES